MAEPATHARRATVIRQRVGATSWEVATRAPCAPLRPHVQELMGYVERAPGLSSRREYPVPGVVVIIDLGEPLRMRFPGEGTQIRHHGGFVAGLDARYVDTQHDGVQHGLQLNLAPLSAARIFGVPLGELAHQVVAFRDLVPRRFSSLRERLAELPSWDARFDVLERVLLELLRDHPPARPELTWATAQLLASGGRLEVRTLARELGYSHKHVIDLFRTHVGLPPKLLGRVARFHALIGALKRGTPRSWAELAVELGYFDQSHLARDVREFAGATPSGLRGLMAPLEPLFPGDSARSR